MVNCDIDAVCTIDESAGSYELPYDLDGYIGYKVDSMGMSYDMNDFRSQGIILPNLSTGEKKGNDSLEESLVFGTLMPSLSPQLATDPDPPALQPCLCAEQQDTVS
jgi:hypothetical protein